MTRTDDITLFCNSKRDMSDAGETMKSVLEKAQDEGRLTLGAFSCAKMLSNCPEDVEICILPELPHGDVSIDIQHKLIEAFCWENDIPLLKVDGVEKTICKMDKKTKDSDLSCMIIKNSPGDDNIMRCYKQLLKLATVPVIQLPV